VEEAYLPKDDSRFILDGSKICCCLSRPRGELLFGVLGRNIQQTSGFHDPASVFCGFAVYAAERTFL